MSHNIKGNGNHLSFSDRVYIEQELIQQSSFRSIAANLNKDPSTISKEVRLHCAVAPNGTYRFPRCNFCNHFGTCKYTDFRNYEILSP
ncbi:MAG: helix-turn-helix domain-containing protein [Agathobacter sp.]|uniref:helix-turn-helix domain-containing protein n=1 Tax=Agathobacter sp. TaxID=2021311 RepID=UPI002583844D|nr:helix-turn-helix domain-containing protein [Agathobacter sp.]MCR5676879.1 helix-turn-helix domain-containing protein [Agathobacter sp.]